MNSLLASSFAGPEPFKPANETPPLQAYVVQVKDGPQVRLSFEVLARSKVAAQRQHEGLCAPGEQCVVYTAAEWELKRFQPARVPALELQINRPDDLSLILRGAER